MTIVARQRVRGLLMPVAAGLVCLGLAVAMPWVIEPFSWPIVLMSLWFGLGGLVFLVAGVTSWRPSGIGLILDKQGVWWKHGCWWKRDALSLLPWDTILGVRVFRWMNEGDEDQSLLLGLAATAEVPFSEAEMAWWRSTLTQKFGPVPWQRVIVLHDENWRWDAEKIAATIEACLANPNLREQW